MDTLFARKLAGDKAYRPDAIDEFLADFDIEPVIPSKTNEDRNERAVPFNPDAY